MAKKITVIGAGNVGATTALRLLEKGLGDVVLVDIIEGLAKGKALDMTQSSPLWGYNSEIIGTCNYEDTKDSDLIIITSGIPRKPGMSREDLVKVNAEIVKSVVEQAVKESPNAIIIVVSNPLDVMTYLAYKTSRFSKEKVMGMAGVLDTIRFRMFLSQELNVSVENIHTCVVGSHGDTMVPLLSHTTVAGIPITEVISRERLNSIVQRTKDGGAEIVGLLKTGSAFYAPAAAASEMAEAILLDKKKILSCTVLCQGQYGIKNTFIGVPAKLGANGVEEIVEFKLNADEVSALRKSAEAVKELCCIVDKMEI
ncbi:MAG TPA: malate dehydrogenase [Candidatus Brocadiia bacterium]